MKAGTGVWQNRLDMKMKSHTLELSVEEGGRMSKLRPLLALCALAIIVLVGCKQPIGLPSDTAEPSGGSTARAAGGTVVAVYTARPEAEDWTGQIAWYEPPCDSGSTQWPYHRGIGNVPTWGYDVDEIHFPSMARPRRNGYVMFKIPYIQQLLQPNTFLQCSLHYRQKDHNGNLPYAVLNLTNAACDPRPGNPQYDRTVFWNICHGYPMAAPQPTGIKDTWYTIPLSIYGNGVVSAAALLGGIGTVTTGWTTWPSTDHDCHTQCYGDGDTEPYLQILVIHCDGQGT